MTRSGCRRGCEIAQHWHANLAHLADGAPSSDRRDGAANRQHRGRARRGNRPPDRRSSAAISETPDHLTRIFLSPEHRAAADLILSWMRDAGMAAHLDAIGNVCGRYEGERPGLPCLMLGSHYDTVRDAGKWDGPLGLITAIACVADLHRRGKRLPFAIEVIGFADEEGVRFASTLLGSRAVAGTFDESVLVLKDSAGDLDARGDDAVRARSRSYRRGGTGAPRTAGLCRAAHRAGPGAGRLNLPGRRRDRDRGRDAARGKPHRHGRPCRHGADGAAARRAGRRRRMHRRDRAVLPDRPGRTGRHRRLYHTRMPGATNVIPGQVSFTIDIRAPTDAHRKLAVADIVRRIEDIAKRRKLSLQIDVTHENRTVPCAPWLQSAGRGSGRSGRFSRVRTAERGRP